VQVGSAVSAVAASGPGVVSPAPIFAPAPAMAAPAVAAAAAPAPISLHQALANGTFGGGSPIGTGVSMVYDPTYNPNAIGVGTGVSMVYDPTAVRSVPAGLGGVPVRGSLFSQQALAAPVTLTGRNTLLGVGFFGADPYG
jgi:hypothetical protein